MKPFTIIATVILSIIILGSCNMTPEVDTAAEKKTIEKVIKDSIGWALNKDTELLYNCMAQDAGFFIFHPDSRSTIVGFDKFKAMVERVFMNDAFKATGFEVKELRINLSKSGEIAWYSCLLDDFGEWNGQDTSWHDVRWTGVLEKRDGTWKITQMHFSKPSDE